jgi:hypothetical protein
VNWVEKRKALQDLQEAHQKTTAEWDVAKKEMAAAFDSGDPDRIEKAMAEDQRTGAVWIEQKIAIAKLKGLLPG